jgi:hypothetical protein
MLPTQYQGLGLPVPSIEKLAVSQHCLQKHWGNDTTYGNALWCSFELVQLETGLQGNFLLRDYDKFGCLATHSWFKILWELVSYYQVQLDLDSVTVPLVHHGDQVFMEVAMHHSKPGQWTSINCARKYFNIYLVSRLVLGDGFSVDPDKMRPGPQMKTSMKFPIEQPTAEDFTLWWTIVLHITSPKLCQIPRLGEYIRQLFLHIVWWTNADTDFLLRENRDNRTGGMSLS